MKKDNQRQGMSELLAEQRAGPPLTPAEAARQRRSGPRGTGPDSVDTAHEDRPVAGTQPPADLPPTEETLAVTGHPTHDQPGGIVDAAAPEDDLKARTHVWGSQVAARVRGRAAGRPRSLRGAVSRTARSKGTLLATTCAVAVAVVWRLVAGRRRRQR